MSGNIYDANLKIQQENALDKQYHALYAIEEKIEQLRTEAGLYSKRINLLEYEYKNSYMDIIFHFMPLLDLVKICISYMPGGVCSVCDKLYLTSCCPEFNCTMEPCLYVLNQDMKLDYCRHQYTNSSCFHSTSGHGQEEDNKIISYLSKIIYECGFHETRKPCIMSLAFKKKYMEKLDMVNRIPRNSILKLNKIYDNHIYSYEIEIIPNQLGK